MNNIESSYSVGETELTKEILEEKLDKLKQVAKIIVDSFKGKNPDVKATISELVREIPEDGTHRSGNYIWVEIDFEDKNGNKENFIDIGLSYHYDEGKKKFFFSSSQALSNWDHFVNIGNTPSVGFDDEDFSPEELAEAISDSLYPVYSGREGTNTGGWTALDEKILLKKLKKENTPLTASVQEISEDRK